MVLSTDANYIDIVEYIQRELLEIGVLIKSGRGHHKLSFDTPRIEMWSLTTEKISKKKQEITEK